jgi:hypothetical protein
MRRLKTGLAEDRSLTLTVGFAINSAFGGQRRIKVSSLNPVADSFREWKMV